MAELIGATLFSKTQYFNRMWTLQETCVAKQVVVAHGSMMLGLMDFFKTVYYLNQTLGYEVTNTDKAVQLQWINAEYRLLQRLPLQVLLYESRDRQCGNLRDRIYGLLGLMYEQPTVLLQPDYGQPVAKVYANATRFIITTKRSLDIICGHEPTKSVAGLPSWTPDYSCFGTDGAVPLVDLSGRKIIHSASLQELPPKLPDLTILPEDWQLLPVSGIYLGTIMQLSRTSQPDETIGEMQQKWNVPLIKHFVATTGALSALAKTSQLIDLYSDYYTNGLHRDFWSSRTEAAALLRSLTMSQLEPAQPVQLMCNKYIVTLLCGHTHGGGRVGELMGRAITRNEAGDSAIETLCKAFVAGMRHRRLFVTDNNDVWGAAPSHAKDGDHVFVLIGCSVPVVLRKLPEKAEYQLVGECFCDGFTRGEALKRRDENMVNIEGIVLR